MNKQKRITIEKQEKISKNIWEKIEKGIFGLEQLNKR